MEYLDGWNIGNLNRGTEPIFVSERGLKESSIGRCIALRPQEYQVQTIESGDRIDIPKKPHEYYWNEHRGSLQERMKDFPSRFDSPLKSDRAEPGGMPAWINVKRRSGKYTSSKIEIWPLERHTSDRKSRKGGWRAFYSELKGIPDTFRLFKVLLKDGAIATGWFKSLYGNFPSDERENLEILMRAYLPSFSTNYPPDLLDSPRPSKKEDVEWRTEGSKEEPASFLLYCKEVWTFWKSLLRNSLRLASPSATPRIAGEYLGWSLSQRGENWDRRCSRTKELLSLHHFF